MGQWRIAFWMTFGVLSVTSVIYILFATAAIQPWNYSSVINEIEAKRTAEKDGENGGENQSVENDRRETSTKE